MKKERRMPTILGAFLIVVLVVSLFLVKKEQIFRSGASGEAAPSEVQITNITDVSFTVSWATGKKTSGLVKLLGDREERVFLDCRDETGELNKFTNHYVEVVGLTSDKDYQFIIISGGKEFFLSSSKPYQTRTARPISGELPKANLASGKVLSPSGEPAAGAIVYISIEGISPLSSLVTNQGNWAVSLAKALSSDLSTLANYQEGKIPEQIFVQGEEGERATAVIFTENDDPVPPIVLGQQYDFTQNFQGKAKLVITPAPAVASKLGTFEKTFVQKPFKISNPEDGEVINFSRPEIFGTGPSGAKIGIILESTVKYEANLEIDDSGEWRWTPAQDLAPGAHTMTVKYIDPQTGKEETFVRSFVLAANAGSEELSFTATPSGETVTPTVATVPTPSPTVTPTAVPTLPPRASQPSTESGVPQSGFWQPTFFLIIGGTLLLLMFCVLIYDKVKLFQ
mgnify:CR=1 FL=1